MHKSESHSPVLLHEAIELLVTDTQGLYVDATFGRGGHSRAILSQLTVAGRLFAMDQDASAVAHGQQMQQEDSRFSIHKHNFGRLQELMSTLQIAGNIDGLLLDLGVSSPQLDSSERGFSFQKDGPLDMRMDQSNEPTAEQWLSEVAERDLATALRDYGDERYAKRIARAIVEYRDQQKITGTAELAELVKQAHPRWEKHHHPATRTFQAIRIAVNRELEMLISALEQARSVIRVGGRLAVISFHSLEDRLVKREIRGKPAGQRTASGVQLPEIPSVWKAVGKAVFPSSDEITGNPRSRSAVLRVAERMAVQ